GGAQGWYWRDGFVERWPRDEGRVPAEREPPAYWRPGMPRPEPPSDRPPQAPTGQVREGGDRPYIEPTAPPVAAFEYDYPPDTILIDTGGRKLYYVLPDRRAYAYTISVGREGFDWAGTEVVSRKQAWPDWYPPAEMRGRDPNLPEKMTGGLKDPLGAMALY